MKISETLIEKATQFTLFREPVFAGDNMVMSGCLLCSGGCIGCSGTCEGDCQGSCSGSCMADCTAYQANVPSGSSGSSDW